MKLDDLTGKRFGRLVVQYRAPNIKRKTMWHCICDCGAEKDVEASSLKCGDTKSCGCYHNENQGNLARTHGLSKHPLYRIFRKMVERCENQNCKSYKDYGGRGIKICDEWRTDFFAFYAWANANGYEAGLSIERINNDGNYEPSNCRWATKIEQNNNRRTSRFIEYSGMICTLSEWSRITNIPAWKISDRIDRLKWSIADALTTPI